MLKRLWCKIIGHRFAGYELQHPVIQEMPKYFYCSRCNSIRKISEGW